MLHFVFELITRALNIEPLNEPTELSETATFVEQNLIISILQF
jgi:hypothetical protein